MEGLSVLWWNFPARVSTHTHKLAYLGQPTSREFLDAIGKENIIIFNADIRIRSIVTLVCGFVKLLRTEKPDAVHFHFGNGWGVMAIIAKLMGVKKLYKTQHSCLTNRGKQVYYLKDMGCSAKLYTFLGKAYNLVDVVLPVSEEVHRQLRGIVGSKPDIQTAYLGIADSGVNHRKPVQGELVVSYIGFANPIKGPDVVIRAVAELKDKNLRLRMIGLDESSPYTAEMHNLSHELGIEDHIEWVGVTDDVKSWLRQSDVFVQSSRTEALSLAAVEAASLAIPVLGSHVGGLPEVANKTFPVGDYKALADILATYYNNPGLIESDGKVARERYDAKFTLDKGVARYNAVYSTGQVRDAACVTG